MATVLAGFPAAPFAADGQTSAAGSVVERRSTAANPQQEYAVSLPPSFTHERRWPVLLILDARGRARYPLSRFQAAADRLGWVVVSSYHSASDGPRQPNLEALQALLPEIEERYPPSRLYLAGFSGTARLAWDLGALMGDRLAGVIGVGAGRPPDYDPGQPPSFAFYGAAGLHDFNFEEMLILDEALQQGSQPHRFAPFEGGHDWPPEETCAAALEWMEIQAMQRGLRPPDEALAASLLAAAQERARQWEGDPLRAADAWAGVYEDFRGLTDAGPAGEQARQLVAQEAVVHARQRQNELLDWRRRYQARFAGWLQQVDKASSPPLAGRSLNALDITGLKRRTDSPDRLEAQAATRALAHVLTYTGFYETRRYLQARRPYHALAMLAVTEAINPQAPRLCLNQARAHAMAGQRKKGLKALECMRLGGAYPADFVRSDPGLEPLRQGEAWDRLIDSWGVPSP